MTKFETRLTQPIFDCDLLDRISKIIEIWPYHKKKRYSKKKKQYKI